MDPLITLDLTFAKTDISEALRMMRIAQMHRGKPSFLAGEILLLERALSNLDRADALSATLSQPLVREEM